MGLENKMKTRGKNKKEEEREESEEGGGVKKN